MAGIAAGAAGTTALNGITYLDMTARARPPSKTPEATVEAVAEKAGVTIPGVGPEKENRIAGLAPLSGLAVGLAVGAGLGLARGLGWRRGVVATGFWAAMGAVVAGNAPMTALGVTDPRTWAAEDWVADIVPHVAYGVVTAAVLNALDRR